MLWCTSSAAGLAFSKGSDVAERWVLLGARVGLVPVSCACWMGWWGQFACVELVTLLFRWIFPAVCP